MRACRTHDVSSSFDKTKHRSYIISIYNLWRVIYIWKSMLLLLLLLRLLFADTFILDFCSLHAAAFLNWGVCSWAEYEFKMNNLTRNENTRKILQIDNNNSNNERKKQHNKNNKSVSFASFTKCENVKSDERKTKQLKNDIFASTTIVLMIFQYGNTWYKVPPPLWYDQVGEPAVMR